MKTEISWITDFKEALDQAAGENKMLLLDFFNPN